MSVLVGRKAPDFTTAAVLKDGSIQANFKFSESTKSKYALLFFYPLDFTFVCPSELIALDHRIDQFTSREVEVMGISIDSHFSHLAWRNTPIEKGGIGPLNYSLVSDMNHEICRAYGVEHPQVGVAFRAAFLVDRSGMVRAQIVNDLPIGRNIDELLRLVDALQHNEAHGEVCPAGWSKGAKGMKATTAGVAEYLAENAEGL
jgi:peroxiredoxin (alkyl hydroperoxide reductase subunit C)